MEFPEIKPSSFYGRKRQEIIRDIPSDSEDSELSDEENEGKIEKWLILPFLFSLFCFRN